MSEPIQYQHPVAATPPSPEAEPEPEPQPQTIDITVPEGHAGGDSFIIELPDGTEIDIDTPEGLVAGDVFEIELDIISSSDHEDIAVPAQAEPQPEPEPQAEPLAGQTLEVMCPVGVGPGDTIYIQYDGEEVEVTIPEGVAAGDEFSVDVSVGGGEDDDEETESEAGDDFSVDMNVGGAEDDDEETERDEDEEDEFSDSEWDDARAGDALGTSRDNYARRAQARAADLGPDPDSDSDSDSEPSGRNSPKPADPLRKMIPRVSAFGLAPAPLSSFSTNDHASSADETKDASSFSTCYHEPPSADVDTAKDAMESGLAPAPLSSSSSTSRDDDDSPSREIQEAMEALLLDVEAAVLGSYELASAVSATTFTCAEMEFRVDGVGAVDGSGPADFFDEDMLESIRLLWSAARHVVLTLDTARRPEQGKSPDSLADVLLRGRDEGPADAHFDDTLEDELHRLVTERTAQFEAVRATIELKLGADVGADGLPRQGKDSTSTSDQRLIQNRKRAVRELPRKMEMLTMALFAHRIQVSALRERVLAAVAYRMEIGRRAEQRVTRYSRELERVRTAVFDPVRPSARVLFPSSIRNATTTSGTTQHHQDDKGDQGDQGEDLHVADRYN